MFETKSKQTNWYLEWKRIRYEETINFQGSKSTMITCKSFLKLKTCGFRRTAAFFVVSSKQLCEEKSTIHEKYEEYCLMFEENIEYISFISNANRLKVLKVGRTLEIY